MQNMKDLTSYVQENMEVDEGLIKNAISLLEIKNIDPQELLNGILSMYDYICDKDDMDLFYQDMPFKQRK